MERIQEITYWLTAWLDDSVQTEKDPAFLAFLQQDTNREDFENMLKKYRKARKIVFCHRICKETAWEKTMQKVRRQKPADFSCSCLYFEGSSTVKVVPS